MSDCFLDVFLARAARSSGSVAFILESNIGSVVVTNAALRDGSYRWAAALRAAGLEAGHVVPIALPLGEVLLEAFIGALIIGAIPSLMPMPSRKQDAGLFWSSHDQLFTRLGCGLIVTTPENSEAIAAHITGVAMRSLTEAGTTALPRIEPVTRIGSDVACLQHSSGTTGLKKGVALTFNAIDAQLVALGRVLGLREGDKIVSWLPLYHDMGFVACFLQPLATGVPAVLLDPFRWLLDPTSLLEACAKHRATLAWMPNFAFAHLLAVADDERRCDLSTIRGLINCSEVCRADTIGAFAARFRSWSFDPQALRTSYAMAEMVFAVTQSGPTPRIVHLDRQALNDGCAVEANGGVAHVSCGAPLPGVVVGIIDANGIDLGDAKVGEIVLAASFLFSGYHLEPERTAAALANGIYRTGDLGFRLGDDIFVLGRHDDVIVLLGRNVYAHDVEALLADVSGLKPGRMVALGIDDADAGTQALVIVAEAAPGFDEVATRVEIRRRLESVVAVTPRKIAFVEPGWLVKSTSGKIARTDTRRKFGERCRNHIGLREVARHD